MKPNPKTQKELDQEWKDYCMSLCRKKRDDLLLETDYIHLPDVSVSETLKNKMITYRQQLRDLPSSFSTLFDEMSETQKDGVTYESIEVPIKPTG